MAGMSNLWDRQQNKRARQKKQRAKQRAFLSSDGRPAGGAAADNELRGIVVGMHRNAVEVRCEGRDFICDPSGDLAVGDGVGLGAQPFFHVTRRFPRKSVVARWRGDWTRKGKAGLAEQVIAANVDLGVIVASAAEPDFHPRFVDRFLAVLAHGQVEPVICLTKSDLASRLSQARDLYGSLGPVILEVSTVTGEGMDAFRKVIAGRTAVLIGHSGTGKSSLLRTLLPEAPARTQVVSKKTGRGRHTTTASRMYEWAPGSFIIDTPGIRSLGLETIARGELRRFFPEFAPFAPSCRFRDCLHDREQDCAVRKAVADGAVAAPRYQSYLRLLREA